jgi:hypothetical protein
MNDNPKIHSPRQLLPYVNEHLKLAGCDPTKLNQVKKNVSVIKKEHK